MNIIANIGIGPSGDLETTARILSEVLHVDFEADTDGSYDEFPAYIADSGGSKYALLGTPDPEDDLRDEPTNEFQLMIRPISNNLGSPKKDVSDEFASKVSEDGRLAAWALK